MEEFRDRTIDRPIPAQNQDKSKNGQLQTVPLIRLPYNHRNMRVANVCRGKN